MKILHLTLKKKWFDMIVSGEKKEEYREIKMYWWKRLVECGECYRNLEDSLNEVLAPPDEWKMLMEHKFDAVKFTNGYGKNTPSILVKCEGIQIDYGMMIWGAEKDKKYFVIQLGEIIN